MSSLYAVALVALKAALLLTLTALAALAARRSSAAIRHLIWSTGLAATLLLPVVPLAVPAWRALPDLRPAIQPRATTATAAITADRFVPAPAPAAIARLRELAPAMAPVAVESAGGSAPAIVAAVAAGAGPNWLGRLVSIWALGAAAVGAWLVAGLFGIRRLRRDAVPLETPEWIATVEEVLADRSFRRPLRFLESETVPTPCTWGIVRPVILLPTSGADWPAIHRRHVVVHELAHVARFDCLTHLVGRVACAIHWFNPLVWLVARSARIAREQACDDAVLNDGGLPSEYAGLLLEAANAGPLAPPVPAAALAMARRSQLGDRLLAVLDPIRRRGGLDRGTVAAAGFGALGLLLPLGAVTSGPGAEPVGVFMAGPVPVVALAPLATRAAPGAVLAPVPVLPQDPDRCRSDGRGTEKTYHLSSSISITGEGSATDHEGNRMVVWTGSDCSVVIRSRGTPRFTEAEDDVAALPNGGSFEVTFERGHTERSYVVTSRNGTLERRYKVDGRAAELDPAALRWRQVAVLEFIRRTGFEVEARTARIWKNSGFDGLLREIDQIESGGGRARYLKTALTTQSVTAPQVTQLLERATAIESDGDRATVLAAIPVGLLLQPGVAEAYLAAVQGIQSDGDKTMVLTRLVRQRPPAATLGTILGMAGTIGSDGDRTNLLAATVDAYPNAGVLPPAFYAAARGITSDGDLASLLTHALASGKVEPGSCDKILGLVGAIESSGDRSSVLNRAMETLDQTPTCLATALSLAADIDSDGDRAGTLLHFLETGSLTAGLVTPLFAAINGIESDGDKSTVLNRVLQMKTPTDAVTAAVLQSARRIGSDGDRAGVLIRAARRGLIRTPELRRAYLAAADEIGSGGDRANALRALNSREAEL